MSITEIERSMLNQIQNGMIELKIQKNMGREEKILINLKRNDYIKYIKSDTYVDGSYSICNVKLTEKAIKFLNKSE